MNTRVRLSILSVFCTLGLTFCNGGSGLPTLAQASVRRISISEAMGTQGRPTSIELAPGMGINISFLNTGETVRKVWLDNPSFVTLDADGCLVGVGANQRNQNCNGAKVLHLKRINPLQFPNLPQTNTSLLTVVTSEKRVYLFKIVKAEKPKYFTVEIVPPQTSVVPQPRIPQNPTQSFTHHAQSAFPRTYDWGNLNRGLQVAVEKRFITTGQPLYRRIQNFLDRTKSGQSVELAAQTAGISMDLVARLNELGLSNVQSTPSRLPIQTISY